MSAIARPSTHATSTDRRVLRTREALLTAFARLFLERGYDRLTVRHVIDRANVGRSTFYEHFESKDDLYRQSVEPLLVVLADTVREGHDPRPVAALLDHWWRHRAMVRGLFAGSAGGLTAGYLAEVLEERLSSVAGASASELPLAFVAAQIAGGLLALVRAWIVGDGSCSPAFVAGRLSATTPSLALALLARVPP